MKNKEVVKLKVYENWLKKGNNNNKIIKVVGVGDEQKEFG
jgi:hypothetical protein